MVRKELHDTSFTPMRQAWIKRFFHNRICLSIDKDLLALLSQHDRYMGQFVMWKRNVI
jgi:hypothetical protein